MGKFNHSFSRFLRDRFEDACVLSTKASRTGDSYSVELFDDGSYQIMLSSSIVGGYESPGMILAVPILEGTDWDDDDGYHYFESAEALMVSTFEAASITCHQLSD